MLGIATVCAGPASAAPPTVYGSAQLKYTVNATAAVSIAVNYSATGAIQAGTASTILPSTAGSCAAGVAEGATANLTFGGITPPAAGYTGCYYKNAISVGVNSNDSAGVKVVEYFDTAVTGTQLCAFFLDATPKAAPTASGAAGNPAAYTASCPTVNAVAGVALAPLGAATNGTSGYGAAGNPPVATNVNATPLYTAYTSGGATLYSTASQPPAGWNYMGQDVQLNVSAAAPSGAQTNVITVAVIPS